MFDWMQSLRESENHEKLVSRFQQMLTDGRHMFDSALTVLVSGGDPSGIREDVFTTDKRINQNEQALRRELVVHGIVHGTSSFPQLLVLMSLAKDAERIGDYAKNLLDLARHNSQLDDAERAVIQGLGQRASELLRQAAAVFIGQDEAKARNLLAEEEAFRHECEEQVSTWVDDQGRNRAAACLCIRFVKRIGGHAGNVISSVCMPLDKLDFHPGGGGDED